MLAKFGMEQRLADGFADDECACRADIDEVEMTQFAGKKRGAKSPVAADVDAAQESDDWHGRIIGNLTGYAIPHGRSAGIVREVTTILAKYHWRA